jgi:hypothetical protein
VDPPQLSLDRLTRVRSAAELRRGEQLFRCAEAVQNHFFFFR